MFVCALLREPARYLLCTFGRNVMVRDAVLFHEHYDVVGESGEQIWEERSYTQLLSHVLMN